MKLIIVISNSTCIIIILKFVQIALIGWKAAVGILTILLVFALAIIVGFFIVCILLKKKSSRVIVSPTS